MINQQKEIENMKTNQIIIAIAGLLFFAGQACADWGNWSKYGTITQGQTKILTIEYRTYHSKNYYPRVQWRATNHTSRTIYQASIGKRGYLLSNNEKVSRGSEGMYQIDPGEVQKYMSDTFGSDGLRVTNVSMDYFTLSFEKSGKRYKAPLK